MRDNDTHGGSRRPAARAVRLIGAGLLAVAAIIAIAAIVANARQAREERRVAALRKSKTEFTLPNLTGTWEVHRYGLNRNRIGVPDAPLFFNSEVDKWRLRQTLRQAPSLSDYATLRQQWVFGADESLIVRTDHNRNQMYEPGEIQHGDFSIQRADWSAARITTTILGRTYAAELSDVGELWLYDQDADKNEYELFLSQKR